MSDDIAPTTPLAPIASALDRAELDRGFHAGPATLLDEDEAVEFPLRLYGRTFTVLAWKEDSYYGERVRAHLYEPDVELHSMQEFDDQHLTYKIIKSGELADEEVADDTQHILATIVGYFTRYLLDGRNYKFRSNEHTEPALDTTVEPSH